MGGVCGGLPCQDTGHSLCGLGYFFLTDSLRRGEFTKWQEGHRLEREIEMVREAEQPETRVDLCVTCDL